MSVEAFYRDRNSFTPGIARGRVSRVSRNGISVCGFASAPDAVRAASVAFHTFRTDLARRSGLLLARLDAPVHAAGVSLHVEKEAGSAPFCFELQFPNRLSAARAVHAARTISDALRRWSKDHVKSTDRTQSVPPRQERDDVDDDSIHSFPASDPPGWISMWAGSPITDAEHPEEVV